MSPTVPLVQYGIREQPCHAWYDEPPDKQRTQGDDKCIAEADDIAKTKDSSTRVVFENELCLLSQVVAVGYHAAGDVLVPPTKGGHDKVVKTADETCDEQRFSLTGLIADGRTVSHTVGGGFLVAICNTAFQHLCGGSSLWEGVLLLRRLYEIATEWDEEQDAKDAA